MLGLAPLNTKLCSPAPLIMTFAEQAVFTRKWKTIYVVQ